MWHTIPTQLQQDAVTAGVVFSPAGKNMFIAF
jgi:hypothetical protein